MPEEVAEGKGACNSMTVKAVQLCDVPMQPFYSSFAMQEPVPMGDYPKKN